MTVYLLYGASEENRTLMTKGHTILSRARLPVPPQKQLNTLYHNLPNFILKKSINNRFL